MSIPALAGILNRGSADVGAVEGVLDAAAKEAGEGHHEDGHHRGLGQVGVAPADGHDHELDDGRRHRAREAVGGLDHGDGHATAMHVPAREEGHEDDETQTVGADGHHHAVEGDHLPEGRRIRAAEETEGEETAAEQHEAAIGLK